MSESVLHLKLDCILTGQDQILNRITEQDETTAILKQIKEDGANMHVMLGRLAPAVAQAAQDAVFMAMGDGVDIPPEAPT
jgi:hypothetical protein